MAEGVDTDPVEVARLGLLNLGSSQAMAEAHLSAQDSFTVPESAFGSTSLGAIAHGNHARVMGNATELLGHLVAVLEGDCDRLYQAAFHYQATDQAAADNLGGLTASGSSSGWAEGTYP